VHVLHKNELWTGLAISAPCRELVTCSNRLPHHLILSATDLPDRIILGPEHEHVGGSAITLNMSWSDEYMSTSTARAIEIMAKERMPIAGVIRESHDQDGILG
jgi:hypothetical protein